MTNYGLAPRSTTCWICKHVANPEDVTVRLISEEGMDLPYADAKAYMAGLGRPVTAGKLRNHRMHVRRAMERPATLPVHRKTEVVTGGVASPNWIRIPDRAIDLGGSALETLAAQLDDLSPAELIQVSRLALSASGKVGDWHAKGRQMGQADRVIDLLFDISRPDGG